MTYSVQRITTKAQCLVEPEGFAQGENFSSKTGMNKRIP
jgi:hypothetical protein